MSVEAAWGLVPGPQDVLPYLKNRDSILQLVKEVLEEHGSPINYLQEKYPSSDKREEYAHTLWKTFPPAEDEPLYLAAELPGESPSGKQILHLACLSFSEASMLQVPAMERCMKLADEILTDGFVTNTEPLMLNGSRRDTMGDDFVPPWGDKTDGGKPTLRAFSVCHHKSAARSATLHLLVNIFMEEIGSNVIDHVG